MIRSRRCLFLRITIIRTEFSASSLSSPLLDSDVESNHLILTEDEVIQERTSVHFEIAFMCLRIRESARKGLGNRTLGSLQQILSRVFQRLSIFIWTANTQLLIRQFTNRLCRPVCRSYMLTTFNFKPRNQVLLNRCTEWHHSKHNGLKLFAKWVESLSF